MIAAMLLVPAAVATLLLFSGTFSGIVVLVLIAMIGLAQGAEVDLLPLLTARYFGLRHYGKIFAFVFAVYTVAVGLSPPLIGYAYDVRHSYDLAIYCITAAWLVSGALFLTLGRYPNWQSKVA
jgi:OFA family oxalate/formate antiporter-like MFS transporter